MLSGANAVLPASGRPVLDGAFNVALADCGAVLESFRFLATCSSSESSEVVRSIVCPAAVDPVAVRRRDLSGTAPAREEELLEQLEEGEEEREAEAALVGRKGFTDGLSAFVSP